MVSTSRPAQVQDGRQDSGTVYAAEPAGYYQQGYSQQSSRLQQGAGEQSPQNPSSYPWADQQAPFGAATTQYQDRGYGNQEAQGEAGGCYSRSIDHAQNYTPSAAAHQSAPVPWNPQTMSLYADPDLDPNAPIDPNAPEGERSLRHAIIGGTTGYIVGHKSGHGGVGAVLGAVTGDFLSDKRHELKHHIREDWGNPSDQQNSQPSNTSGHSSHNSGHHHHSRH